MAPRPGKSGVSAPVGVYLMLPAVSPGFVMPPVIAPLAAKRMIEIAAR
jgi:hypothetical protein